MRHAIRTMALLSVLAVVFGVSAAYAQPNFSGTWVLDQTQSHFNPAIGADGQPGRGPHGPRGEGGPQGDHPKPQVKLTVEQSGTTLKATRTLSHDGRERAMSETYSLDGKETTRTGRRGGTSVTRAAFDGDRLVVNSTHAMKNKQGDQVQMSRESVWSLSPDGATLTIQTTMQGPRGERTMTSVYQKS